MERGTGGSEKSPDSWISFQKVTNELLSVLVRSEPSGKEPPSTFFADSTREVFSNDGRYWATAPNNEPNNNAINYGIRLRVVAVAGFEALEYSHVTEHLPPRENRLAHGYVLFGDHTVFLQHTSTRPIAPDVAENLAHDVMRRLQKVSSPANLRPFNKQER
jgi:hypothetical protein